MNPSEFSIAPGKMDIIQRYMLLRNADPLAGNRPIVATPSWRETL